MKKRSGINNRIIRINDEILREVANIIRSELKDPRISKLTSVTKVDTTNDLSFTKIYVSIMAEENEKNEVMEGLKNASGYIRRQLANRINLRNTPEVKFCIDDSLDYSTKINDLLKQVHDSRESEEL